MNDKKIFGIDFGATNSTIAFINDNEQPEVIPNPETYEMTTPSVVYFESMYNIIAGKIAKESSRLEPDNVIEYIKREIGTPWQREFFGVTYNPEMITAMILRHLAQYAEDVTGIRVEDVVITCPAYFSEEQKHALYNACYIAGLNVIQILEEPVAAALGYASTDSLSDLFVQTNEEKTVLVYDLGGSTFNCSVLSIFDNCFFVKSINGNRFLGGINWNQRIMDYLAYQFQEETGCEEDLNDDVIAKYELGDDAECIKQSLSRRESTMVPVSYEGERARIQLSRELFNTMTQDLLERTFDLTDSVLDQVKNAGIKYIDEIYLVGGSTLMPQVQDGIKERYADPMGIPVLISEPDLVVAKGAAQYAYMQSNKIRH